LKTTCIIKHVEDKSLAWFEPENQYVVLEKITGIVLEKIHKKTPVQAILKHLDKELDIPLDKAKAFVSDVQQFYQKNTKAVPKEDAVSKEAIRPTGTFEYIKYYHINDLVVRVEYASKLELELVHLKFAHLETTKKNTAAHTFSVFRQSQKIYLLVNNNFIGAWTAKDVHYFQGKFSMELVQVLYQKKEAEWLGVFHASAVGKNGKCMLFLGDSGNGKSTSLALLQAHGFECVADDFVPVEAHYQDVYKFPAAISIKRNSFPVLLPYYPILETSEEFHLKQLDKHVRYLPPVNQLSPTKMPCNGFVFIKYDAKAPFSCTQIPSIRAFEKIVPDSWLSPIAANAATFLDWFSKQPCYELIYNDNSEMISEVHKLFENSP
tara:strand:- start:509 stop:1642 length:1134 start_codon:yes stop_codon:yes gene_type:complete